MTALRTGIPGSGGTRIARRRPLATTLLALLALPLAGCRPGPDAEALRREVQARLDAGFEPGLFEVVGLERDGSQPYRSDEGEDRLLVYFRARLRIARDLGLSSWDKRNAGSLAALLGAGPQGISGIRPDGNRAGEELKVFGTSAYRPEAGGWVPLTRPAPAPEPVKAEVIAARDETPLERRLRHLDRDLRQWANQGRKDLVGLVETRLVAALRDIALDRDALEGTSSLLTGSPTGAYAALGVELARTAETRSLPLGTHESRGSVESCRLVGTRQADFALAQSDVVAMAWRGSWIFESLAPHRELRGVTALFPEAVQIVVKADSPIRTVADLAGRRLSAGPVGSGSRLNAQQILEATGLGGPGGVTLVESPDLDDSFRQLAAGKVDAVSLTMAYPARPLEEFSVRTPVRLVPIPPETAGRLGPGASGHLPITIPSGTYLGQDEELPTLGVMAMLVTHSEVPAARVEAMLSLLFEGDSPAATGGLVTRRSATIPLPIPLHPAAEAWRRAAPATPSTSAP